MTQYLISVHVEDSGYERAADGDSEPYAGVDTFNDEIRESGHWAFGAGLEAPATATVIDGTGARPVLTDGPYLEAKEHLGGFWVVEAADLDEALDLGRRASAACRAAVEVRPIQPA